MTFNLINPNDFQVARVISFYDSTINRYAKVCYFRPMKNGYNKTTFDDFDKSIVEWLKGLNLQNVDFCQSDDIVFDHQKPQLGKIYNGGRPSSKLLLTCHGDYTMDEFVVMGKIDASVLELNIYWNAMPTDVMPHQGGIMTFDNTKEQYYFDVIKQIESL